MNPVEKSPNPVRRKKCVNQGKIARFFFSTYDKVSHKSITLNAILILFTSYLRQFFFNEPTQQRTIFSVFQ